MLWNCVVRRVDDDPIQLYAEARALGVKIVHTRGLCQTWDSTDGQPGVFRSIGLVIFDKDSRRWEARVMEDCSRVELCTLLWRALGNALLHGQHPGQGLRGRCWHHETTCTRRRAVLPVCYQLDASDLLETREEKISAPDTIADVVNQGVVR